MVWAFVARMMHVDPAFPGVRVEPDKVHVLLDAGTTSHVTAPVPEPPLVVSDSVSPYVTDVEETVNVACVARDTVTVWVSDTDS